jgi:hypothetical protein
MRGYDKALLESLRDIMVHRVSHTFDWMIKAHGATLIVALV